MLHKCWLLLLPHRVACHFPYCSEGLPLWLRGENLLRQVDTPGNTLGTGVSTLSPSKGHPELYFYMHAIHHTPCFLWAAGQRYV